MLKVQEIRELIKLVDQSNLEEFVYEFENSKIKMKKSGTKVVEMLPAVQQVALQTVAKQDEVLQAVVKEVVKDEQQKVVEPKETSANKENIHTITSPMVGTFYSSPTPDADPYVTVGRKVSKGSVVCIVEAMKLFNEIEAETDGEIIEILVNNGQLVEYGQPLFVVSRA